MNSNNYFISKWMIFKKIIRNISPMTIWIFIGSLIPLLITFLLVFLVFDNPINALQKMYTLRGRPNDTSDAFSALSDIITLLITTYGILLTALFSFLVYTVSKQGVEISNEIKKLETSRDSDALCEQALIVFHEFQRSVIHLRDLFVYGASEDKIQSILKHFHFSEDWIRNIATLRSGLTTTELEKLYDIYNEFNMLKKLLEGDAPSIDVKNHVTNLSDKIFTKSLHKHLIKEFKYLSAEHIINNKYFIIMHKIYFMTFSPSQVEVLDGETKLNGVIHKKESGDTQYLYTTNGLLKLVLNLENEKKEIQQVFGYNKSGKVIYSQKKHLNNEDSHSRHQLIRDESYSINDSTKPYYIYFFNCKIIDKKIINGVYTTFHKKGTIKFRGYVDENGNITEGVRYDIYGNRLFEGLFENGQRLIGDLYQNDFVVFSGEFKNNLPWEGEAYGLSSPKDQVIDFHGSIVDGKLLKGTGFQFKQNNFGETYQERLNNQENSLNKIFYTPHDSYDDTYLNDDAYVNELLRDNYGDWEDYLSAEWVNGKIQLHSDEEHNIKVIKS